MRKAEESVQISVRIPAEALKKIDAAAEQDGRTRNNMINHLLEMAVRQMKKADSK